MTLTHKNSVKHKKNTIMQKKHKITIDSMRKNLYNIKEICQI